MRWLVDIGRETSDIDFATIGEQTADKVTSEFMEIMGIDANDGLRAFSNQVVASIVLFL